ncbi:MAG: hypothetical protein KF830_12150 [Planctomycetes bacterium]|nr:hypothetical protein [Planctomycetota bacterium]
MPRVPILPRSFAALGVVALLGAAAWLVHRLWIAPPIGIGSIVAVLGLTMLGLAASWTSRLLHRDPRHPVRKPWLALASMAIACAAFDLFCGLWRPSAHGPAMAADARRHHRLLADQDTVVHGAEFAYRLRTNSRGLRGGELAVPKPAGVRRLLFLGDSFTMGKGVEEADTFAARVEAGLNATAGAGRCEVVNAGVDSYAPVLSRLQFEELLDIEPDHVVHCLDMSDLMQEQAYRRLALRDADGRILAVQGRPRSLAEWVMQHTLVAGAIVAWLRDASDVTVGNFVRQPHRELLRHTLAGDEVDRTHQWRELFDSIDAIAGICRRLGVRYTLVVYPWGHQVDGDHWRTGRSYFVEVDAAASDMVREVVAEHARQIGVDLVDAFDAFRAYRGPEPLYYDADMHFTPAGHAVLAQVLVDALRR